MNRLLLFVCLLFFASLEAFAIPIPQAGSQLGYVSLATFTNTGPGAVNGNSPEVFVLDGSGNFYGVLQSGSGATANGAVFEGNTNRGIVWTLGMTNAANPSQLLQGVDGNLYGLGSGIVFSVGTNGNFRWTAAATNEGSASWLTGGADGNLYGACPEGGASSNGQIVSLDTNGAYRWVFSFGKTNGQTPSGPLTAGRDGNLYGMTTNGGAGGNGTVYCISTNGKMNWSYSMSQQLKGPYGELIQGTSGDLYGSSYCMGYNDLSVFSISTNGLTNWVYTPGRFNVPNGTLVQGLDGNLYIGSQSSVFSITSGGVSRWSMNVGASMRAVRSDGDIIATVYGSIGPTAPGFGIYSITPAGEVDGSALVTNGYSGSIVQDGAGNFFGGAGPFPSGGGGQIFELAAAPVTAQQPQDVIDFSASAATFSVSVIGAPMVSYQWQKDGTNVYDGGNLSGTQSNVLTIASVSASDAGDYNVVASNYYGTVISLAAELSSTHSFPIGFNNGTLTIPNLTLFGSGYSFNPYLVIAGRDGYLYGTTLTGVIYKATTNGNLVWSINHAFQFLSVDALIQGSDGILYGCDGDGVMSFTTNGNAGFGSITGAGGFEEIAQGADGNLYWTKNLFTGVPGIYATTTNNRPVWSYTNIAYPDGVTVGQDGNIYATSATGGTNNDGAVLALAPSGSLLWTYSFAASNGLYPGGVIQGADGFLYGTAIGDGTNSFGNVFKISTNGILAWSFSFGSTNGSFVYSELVQATDGNLYGVTAGGGEFGQGEIFRITTNGEMAVVYSFTGGSDGRLPKSGPVQGSDGALYGVTLLGGFNDAGTLYRLDIGLPPIGSSLTAPAFHGASISNGVITLSWQGPPETSYQLQFSDDLNSGSWSNLGTVITATSSVTTVVDGTTNTKRFYRLQVAQK